MNLRWLFYRIGLVSSMIKRFNAFEGSFPSLDPSGESRDLASSLDIFQLQDGEVYIDPFTGKAYPGPRDFNLLKSKYEDPAKVVFTDEASGQEFFTKEGEKYFCRTRDLIASSSSKVSKSKARERAKKVFEATGNPFYVYDTFRPRWQDSEDTSPCICPVNLLKSSGFGCISKLPSGVSSKFAYDASSLLNLIEDAYSLYGEPITGALMDKFYRNEPSRFNFVNSYTPWSYSDRLSRYTKYLSSFGLIEKEGKGWVPVK